MSIEILGNVTVVEADLQKFAPSITDYISADATAADFITKAKNELYRELKLAFQIDDDRAQKLKDDETGSLLDKICLLAISKVYRASNLLDLAESFKGEADAILVEAHYDDDEDDVIDDGELQRAPRATFGR